jgi:uncharacterized repeat protein (TIGR03803 family)
VHSFTGAVDGAFPYAGLLQARDGYIYGVNENGGSHFLGTIFRTYLAGGYTTLYSFTGGNEGANPYGRLVQSTNGYLWGTAAIGGSNGYGTVFRMILPSTISGIHQFTGGVDGANPETGVTVGADGAFYGASTQGGEDSYGSIYRVTPGGVTTVLYSFQDGNDGALPLCDLTRGSDGNIYGTTVEGGQSGYGTVFRVATNGALTSLASFSGTDGAYPEAGVIQGLDGNFYGTTYEGGLNNFGTVFCLATNGTLTTLYSFSQTDGSHPAAELLQGSDGNFYGTCSAGGAGGQGTVYRLTPGGQLTTLYWFDGLNGATPASAPIQTSDGNFFGTTVFGGPLFNASAGGGYGTIYHLTVPIFTNRSCSAASAIACLPYSGSVAGNAVAPSGDTLSFAKVSGPAWLTVATNGALAGTPTNSDIGTNWFVVSLTDAHGLSASANLSVVVAPDPPPAFLASPFTQPWANVDNAYAGNISTNGTAPYLAQGDRLTFGMVSGPAWLEVAPDGTLSGTPNATYAGTNQFIVSVTDLGGSSNTAAMIVYVNSAPEFVPSIFAGPTAFAGVPYADTIATNAVDPDLAAGDYLTFYKLTGPAWLNVAGDGTLSGTPAVTDAGANTFRVIVWDSGNLVGAGQLSVQVIAVTNTIVSPIFLSITPGGSNVLVGWSGGIPPYQLQVSTNPVAGWQNVGGPTTATNWMVTPAAPQLFYRVQRP